MYLRGTLGDILHKTSYGIVPQDEAKSLIPTGVPNPKIPTSSPTSKEYYVKFGF